MNITFRAVFVQVFGSTQIQFISVCNFSINIIDLVDWHQY